jgi:hypothetical protein
MSKSQACLDMEFKMPVALLVKIDPPNNTGSCNIRKYENGNVILVTNHHLAHHYCVKKLLTANLRT